MENDYELIYLYQEEAIERAKVLLYEKYFSEMVKIQKWIINKYYALPIEINDLYATNYLAFVKALTSFNQTYRKSFHHYLVQNVIWDSHNYINKFLTKKHQVLNNAFDYDDEMWTDRSEEEAINFNFAKICRQELFLQNFKKLSQMEQAVFLLKREGWSYKRIASRLKITTKRVDNVLQRIVVKFQLLWVQNHV